MKRIRIIRRARFRRIFSFVIGTLMLAILLIMVRIAPWRSPLLQTMVFGSESSKLPGAFMIGSFLANRAPGNVSYCIFPFGTSENFSLPEEVAGSPELGDKSPYRVVYNVVLGRSYNVSRMSVTFATHATLEYMIHIAEIARAWESPVSVACFLPSSDLAAALVVLETLCVCERAMANVSVHLVYHMDYTPNASVSWRPDLCLVPPAWMHSTRLGLALPYPVNVARNVARIAARSHYILVADIELFPSAGLASDFLNMLDTMPKRRTGDHSFLKKRHVYVVPVFEVVADVTRLPRTKRELLRLHAEDRAVYFHRFVCLHCQQFPGLQQWLQRRNKPRPKSSIVQPMLVVKREFPHHRWEPVYIGTQREPLYSELLTWEGQQDKMTQMYEMCLLDYRFVILDGAFLVHTPGVKTRKKNHQKLQITNGTTSMPGREQMRRNSYLYKLITDDLTNKYPDNRHCKKQ